MSNEWRVLQGIVVQMGKAGVIFINNLFGVVVFRSYGVEIRIPIRAAAVVV